MATVPYSNKGNLEADNAPWFLEDTVPQNGEIVIEWLNVTRSVTVINLGLFAVRIALVSAAGGGGTGAQGDERYTLLPGHSVTEDWQLKSMIIREDDNLGTVDISVTARLSPFESGAYPDITDANEFDGIESHNSVT